MAEDRADLMRRAVRNLSDERDNHIRSLATDYKKENLNEHLEALAKIQTAIEIIKRDIGPAR